MFMLDGYSFQAPGPTRNFVLWNTEIIKKLHMILFIFIGKIYKAGKKILALRTGI